MCFYFLLHINLQKVLLENDPLLSIETLFPGDFLPTCDLMPPYLISITVLTLGRDWRMLSQQCHPVWENSLKHNTLSLTPPVYHHLLLLSPLGGSAHYHKVHQLSLYYHCNVVCPRLPVDGGVIHWIIQTEKWLSVSVSFVGVCFGSLRDCVRVVLSWISFETWDHMQCGRWVSYYRFCTCGGKSSTIHLVAGTCRTNRWWIMLIIIIISLLDSLTMCGRKVLI